MSQAAWSLHVAGLFGPECGHDTLLRADEHLLALLLAAEPDLAAALCERSLAPLRVMPAGAAARNPSGDGSAGRVARVRRHRS